MKRKLYTKAHDINILKEINNDEGRFTAEEHAYAVKEDSGRTVLETKEGFLHYYLQNNWQKLSSLQFLIERILTNEYKNILSFGAGQCVLEYLLKLSLPGGYTVVANDFDAYLIEKVKYFFPEITSMTFDFFKDKIKDIEDKVNLKFDMAVFFGSAYAMDDKEFMDIFKELKKSGVKEIIDFHAGYIDLNAFFRTLFLTPLKRIPLVRKLFKKAPLKEIYKGKFHGYARSKSELRNLYRRCGFKIIKECSIANYKYVAILQ